MDGPPQFMWLALAAACREEAGDGLQQPLPALLSPVVAEGHRCLHWPVKLDDICCKQWLRTSLKLWDHSIIVRQGIAAIYLAW